MADYEEINGEEHHSSSRYRKHSKHHHNRMEQGHGGGLKQLVSILTIIAVVLGAVCVGKDDLTLSSTHPRHAMKVNPATLSLDLKHLKAAGPPVPRHHDAVVTAAKEEETVDFKMPKGAKPGQILHVLVPGQHDLQAIRVPSGAKAGMMLSVKVPIKASLEGEVGGEHAEGAAAPAGETPEDEDIIEEVEEDAEIAEEDVAFTWSHFFLLILFVASCTVVMFYFIKGVVVGFGPLKVDVRKVIDHPCRFCDEATRRMSEQQMALRRETGAEDTPESTPRGGGTPQSTPREDTKKGTGIRAVGRSEGFKKHVTAEERGTKVLRDEGEDIKATVKDYPQGTTSKGSPRDEELEGESQASENPVVDFTSQEVFAEVWERGKWLVALLIVQSIASMVLSQFEQLIKEHVVIALFLTMLIGAGGNAGGQTVAKCIHEIAVRGRTRGDLALVLRSAQRQIAVAVWLAVIIGWAAWVRVWIFHGGVENSMAISISCAIIVFSSIVFGSMLPYAMLAVGLDEIHSGAVIQVLMDIYGVTMTCMVCWFFWG